MTETPDWARKLVELRAYAPAHLGYQNGCTCERCLDRAARTRWFRAEGRAHPDSEAKRESEDYFRRPWQFRLDEEAGFHRPLRV